MHLDNAEQATDFATAAQAAMREHSIAPTPQNFAIWYEYHAGRNIELKRTLDIYVSNRQPFDDRLLQDLHSRFFTLMQDHQSVRETSQKVHERLHGILDLMSKAQGAGMVGGMAGGMANGMSGAQVASASGSLEADMQDLTALIGGLVSQTLDMAGRSEQLNQHLEQSANEVASLQRTLDETLREATIDGLTGVSNRRSFDLRLRQLAGDAMNSGDDLCLLLIDIDHFKRINDTLGHQAGDDVLRMTAETLRQTLRKQDFIARYGGEEFAVILEGTALEKGEIVGNKLRQAVAERSFPLSCKDQVLSHATISAGVSCYEPGEPLTEWIERVDMALYQAKNEGRDRVVSSSTPEQQIQLRTFLLVDDSKVVRKVARRLLEGFGFRVEEVDDGAPGVEFCKTTMPDAVLLDWNMPVMSGIDFLKALRAMEGGSKPVVVFCTTESDMKFVQAALDAGANEYIFKPFDSEVLRGKLEKVGLLPPA